MVTASDLEIFVLTYNRATLLKSTINTIVGQSESGVRICILDNGSTDETPDIVLPFLAEGVEYFRNEINDHLGAWDQIKKISSRSWIMVFHDDDLLHPEYVKSVLNVINRYPGISLVGCAMSEFRVFDTENWTVLPPECHHFCSSFSDLAYLLFKGFPMPFCSAVYRADIFRELQLNVEIYSKIFDRPFMMDASKAGGAVILKGKYVRARIHIEQDSKTISERSYVPELIALNRYYFHALGQNIFTKSGRLFLTRNYSRLLSAYEWSGRQKTGYTKSQFMELAIKGGGATALSIRLGAIYNLLFGWPRRFAKQLLQSN